MSKAQAFLSLPKIIILVMIISATLITSLFVFHLRNPKQPINLSNDKGMLFPFARDIKPFELATENASFTQNNFRNHWTLLFFGFTHCSSICPITLAMLNRAYDNLHKMYPDLQVVLVSLDPERDTPSVLNHYARSFNQNFIGVSGKIQAIRKLQSQFGIYSNRDDASSNYQIQHTSSIMLINKEGKWAGLYQYGMTPNEMTIAFKESMNKLIQ